MQLHPVQVKFNLLYSVKNILKSRGFEVEKEGDCSDILLPSEIVENHGHSKFLFDYYNSPEDRKKLLAFIKEKPTATEDEAIKGLLDRGMIPEHSRFTRTFEWYIGQLMVRKFAAFSSSYGVEVKNVLRNTTGTSPGDYDAVAVMLNHSLIYFECKTGSFDSDDITKASERGLALHCEATVVVSMKPINEEILITTIDSMPYPRLIDSNLQKLSIKGLERHYVYEWGNCFFIDGYGNIEAQLRVILRIIDARRNQYGKIDERKVGYNVQTLLRNVFEMKRKRGRSSTV